MADMRLPARSPCRPALARLWCGLWLCLWLCLCAGPARAATYSADASAINASVYPWIDLSASGTTVALGDDVVSGAINIGFSFTFGSSAYTSVKVMSNGMLQFAGTSTAFQNTSLPLDGSRGRPNIDAVMLPLWDDLNPANGQVRYQSQGTAPNRIFTVSWNAVPYYSSNNKNTLTATFQVQLHESGVFVFRYGAVDGSGGAHSNGSGLSNPAGAVIGVELNSGDYLQYARNSAVVPSGTTIVWTRAVGTPLAEYLFNEAAWAGTAGEVRDSSGNALHGTAAGLSTARPGTGSASPAVAGTTGTCGYGVFKRTNKDYVALPAGFANLGSAGSFTVTAWIRSSDSTLANQRIFIDDENNTGGLGLSLGDPGAGRLRFGTRGTPSSYALDTAAVISSNTWYFVAFGVNTATKVKTLFVYDAAGTPLAALSGAYTEAGLGSDSGIVTVGGESNGAVGGENTASYGFAGNIDELRVYGAALTPTQLGQVRGLGTACPAATLVASYAFEELGWTGSAGELTDSAGHASGPFHGKAQGQPLPLPASASPARGGSPGTCSYASLGGPSSGGASFISSGLPLSQTTDAQTTLAFWMYWSGNNGDMVASLGLYGLWFNNGAFGFNTDNGDVYGIASAGLANGWHHVVAVFGNGSVGTNRLYLDGVAQALSQRVGTPNPANAVSTGTLQLSGYPKSTSWRFSGSLDEVRVYDGALSAAAVGTLYSQTHTCTLPLHHLEIRHGSGSGLTCTPSTVTIAACQDAACSTPYTGGVSGTLVASGAGMTVNWPGGAGFNIAAGASSTTEDLQLVTAGSVLLDTSGLSVSTTAATNCNFGSPACTYTAADAGLLFDVPHHVAAAVQTVSVSAVKKADNSLACTPAFASTSKAVTFSCAYTNPASGSRAVVVGGVALNAANQAGAACDANGGAVMLAFNAGGVASTSVQYADVGQLTLAARYSGSGSDAGLTLSGSDSFVAAPASFGFSAISAGPIKAGSLFSATVTAFTSTGTVAPNFGREASAESVLLGFARLQPGGSGAVNGSFSGSLGGFAGGSASGANLAWTEVGRGDLVARLGSDNYLGTGFSAHGASAGAGATWCAAEGGTCNLPSTATVYYGQNGSWFARAGVSGSIGCNNTSFGDPLVGVVKRCFYVATAAGNGAVGNFIPHHFDLALSAACGSFSYAGQAFAATVTARNASGGTTVNYDGSNATSPNFARAVTLSETAALGVGTLGGTGIAASAFSAGVASSTTPVYTFSSKTTAPRTLVLRATDTDAVSSAGYAEGSMALRSGRLRLSNTFGSARAALQVPVVAEYWSGASWLLNSADSCTTVAAASVALSNPRSAAGGATTAASGASAVSLVNGSGLLILAAPSPAGSSLSLDLAINLGSGGADQSCQANHPATTGAAKPWLRAQNGACAATADRDPAARASFGIFSPETRKTVHVREIF